MTDEQKRIIDRWTDNSTGYCYNPRAMAAELLSVPNCGTCGSIGTVTSIKARCSVCGMFAELEPK